MNTKPEYLETLLLMEKDCKILFNEQSYQNSVYLGGYVLETFLKWAYLEITGMSNFPRGTHNYNSIHHDIRVVINSGVFTQNNSMLMREIDNLLNSTSSNHLNNLCSGNSPFPAWDPFKRYKVNSWDDRNFSENIKNEVHKIVETMIDMELQGVINTF